MIATVTTGKRRAGKPSDSGSMSGIVFVPRVARIGEFADALRKATRSARQHAEIAHRFGVLADSRLPPLRHSRQRQSNRRSSMDTTVDQFRERVQTQISKARWALGINGALAAA